MDKLPVALLEISLLLIASLALAELPRPEDVLRQGVKRFDLTEHARLNWPLQEVSFPLEFADDECRERSIMLVGPDGKPMACQLSEVTYHGSDFVKSARLHFLATLAAGESKAFGVYYSSRKGDVSKPIPSGLSATPDDAPARKGEPGAGPSVVLANGKIALRVANGKAKYKQPQLSMDVPAPIMAVRGPDGVWRGRGYLDTWWRVLGYETAVTAGPVFAEVRTTYRFESDSEVRRDKTYTIRVRLVDQMDYAHVEEQMSLGPRCTFVFDCSANFAPDRLGLTTAGANVVPRQLNYFDDVLQARMNVFTQYTQLFDFRDALGVYQEESAKDFIGLFFCNPGEWTRAKVNTIEFWERRQLGDDVLTRGRLTTFGKTDALPNPNTEGLHGRSVYSGHFTWEFPLNDGRREWCLTVTDKTEQFRRGTARLREQVTQVAACPLDWAKDMVLSWPAPPLPEGAGAAADSRAEDRLERRIAAYVEGFYNSNGWSTLNAVSIRGIAPMCDEYAKLRADGELSAEEDAIIRARLAFLAYVLRDPDNYPYDKAMLPFDHPESSEPLYGGMLNQNFHTDIYNAVGSIGLAFPEHPESKAWVDHFRKQLDAQLAYYLYPQSGCWEESHTYANHVMHTLLPTLHKLRKQGVNLFADERLKKMFNFFVISVTPFDKNHGSRVTPNAGDHDEGTNYREIYRSAAEGFVTVDEPFARNLMWMYREMGGKEAGPVGADHRVCPPEAPALPSQWLQGFGAVLRAKDAQGDETWMLLRVGESWGHHHADDNSIHMYAKGAPLISDAGKGSRISEDWKYNAYGHSRISLPEVNVHNYVGRHHRGWIKDRYFSEAADYLLGYTPFLDNLSPRKDGNPAQMTPINPGFHDRQVLFVRPDYFLVRDTVRSSGYSEDLWLHLDATEIKQDGNVITAITKNGVELDMIFLQGLGKSFDTGTVNGKPVATRYVKISQRPDSDFIYLLYPRRTGDPRPAVQPIRDARGIIGTRVERGNAVETLFLSHEPVEHKEGDIEFRGIAGLVRVEGDATTVSLCKGEMIRCGTIKNEK